MAKFGTLAHYKQAADRLDAARKALEADGADPALIDALLEATYNEALSGMACDGDGRQRAARERARRNGVSLDMVRTLLAP
jgi:hypothetical protein